MSYIFLMGYRMTVFQFTGGTFLASELGLPLPRTAMLFAFGISTITGVTGGC